MSTGVARLAFFPGAPQASEPGRARYRINLPFEFQSGHPRQTCPCSRATVSSHCKTQCQHKEMTKMSSTRLSFLLGRCSRIQFLFVTLTVGLVGFSIGYFATPAVQSKASMPVLARVEKKSGVNFQDGHAVTVNYTGGSKVAEALRSGRARPLSLAEGDFDMDGAAD